MRARNREINIFNMSLLDILTGMLGAFLFLMLGLLPYYAKVKKTNPDDVIQLNQKNKALQDQVDRQQQQVADLQKQLEELQKIVKQSAGGPLTAEQIQQLMDRLNQMQKQLDDLRGQNQQLQAQNGQLQNQLTQAQQQGQQAQQQAQQQLQQARQDLADMKKDRDFWASQAGTISIASSWDAAAADIDVLVMSPGGKIFTPKPKDKVLGKDAIYDGDDSHSGGTAFNTEGLLVFLDKPGDYLVFYRVPKGAAPAAYANLTGHFMYSECIGKDKGYAVREDSLGPSKSSLAAPGGLYAWAIINYDPKKPMVVRKKIEGKLPPGIMLPENSSQPTPAPVLTPAPSATPSFPP